MNKSFQESNGTVLSTNWKDIGSKKVWHRDQPGLCREHCFGGMTIVLPADGCFQLMDGDACQCSCARAEKTHMMCYQTCTSLRSMQQDIIASTADS